MNPVFCWDGFNYQSGKVKILETRHLAHGGVQAARRGTVLEQLLYRGDKLGFIVCCPDGPMISKYNNGPKLTYRRPRMLSTYIVHGKISFRRRSLCKRIF
jgi:hypothetical protein